MVFYCVVRGVFGVMPMDFLKSSKLSTVAMTTNKLLIGKCHSYVGWYSYRPQRSCGKVVFSQASVILFRGGRVWQGMGGGMHGRGQGACVGGGMYSRGHAWQGGMHGRGTCMAGGYAWQGVCVARGGA